MFEFHYTYALFVREFVHSVFSELSSFQFASVRSLSSPVLDTSGDVSRIFFNAESQGSHRTHDVALLQLRLIRRHHPTTGPTGHRHGERAIRASFDGKRLLPREAKDTTPEALHLFS